MFKNTIDQKPLFKKGDGNEVRDLTQTMLNLKGKNYINFQAYKVPKEYVMRPDLISMAVYNSTEYTEMILKFNGISNPFTINYGDIILIPDLEDVENRIKTPSDTLMENDAERIRNAYKYLDPLKLPTTSTEDFDNRKYDDTPDTLPPNISQTNTPQVVYRNGRAYFGEGAESCLKDGMTSGEYIANVISNNNRRNNNK